MPPKDLGSSLESCLSDSVRASFERRNTKGKDDGVYSPMNAFIHRMHQRWKKQSGD